MAVFILLKEKFNRLLKRSLSFKAACSLSIVVHGMVFIMAAIFLRIFAEPNLYSPPLIFDYVFSPVQEIGESTERSNDVQTPESKPANSKSRPGEKIVESQTAETRAADWPASDSDPEPGPGAPNALPSREEATTDEAGSNGYVHEEAATAEGSPFFVDAVFPTRFSIDQPQLLQPHRVTAKISISPDQKKMLLKKVKKWSENLDPNNWTEAMMEWRKDGRTYSARVQHQPARSATALDEAVIEISTEEDGYAVSTEMRLRRLAFSNFAQFVDYWDPQVAVHNDELNGRFHANTTINVSSSRGVQPKFHGKVTTASYDVNMGGPFPVFDQKTIFIGGLETGVKEIRLPKTNLPFLSDSTISENQWHRLTEETWLHFRGDGTYSWRSKSSEKEQKQLLPNLPLYIVGEKDARLHVKGVLRGQVLIYAADRIIIDDDIIYSRHPEAASDADDFLGLVSERDIEIAHPDITGPGDLHIHASIYAKGRFRVRHLQGKNDATLYIYGSLTAGSLSATEPRYATHISFDKRLESRRPPNFPMSDRYELKEWDGSWKLKPRGKSGVLE